MPALHARLERLERAQASAIDTPQMQHNAAKAIDFDYDEFARILTEVATGLSAGEIAEWEARLATELRALEGLEQLRASDLKGKY